MQNLHIFVSLFSLNWTHHNYNIVLQNLRDPSQTLLHKLRHDTLNFVHIHASTPKYANFIKSALYRSGIPRQRSRFWIPRTIQERVPRQRVPGTVPRPRLSRAERLPRTRTEWLPGTRTEWIPRTKWLPRANGLPRWLSLGISPGW